MRGTRKAKETEYRIFKEFNTKTDRDRVYLTAGHKIRVDILIPLPPHASLTGNAPQSSASLVSGNAAICSSVVAAERYALTVSATILTLPASEIVSRTILLFSFSPEFPESSESSSGQSSSTESEDEELSPEESFDLILQLAKHINAIDINKASITRIIVLHVFNDCEPPDKVLFFIFPPSPHYLGLSISI